MKRPVYIGRSLDGEGSCPAATTATKTCQTCKDLRSAAHQSGMLALPFGEPPGPHPVIGPAEQGRIIIVYVLVPNEGAQQLARLRAEGLVSARRDGKAMHYSLASEDVRVIIGAVHQVFCRGGKRL